MAVLGAIKAGVGKGVTAVKANPGGSLGGFLGAGQVFEGFGEAARLREEARVLRRQGRSALTRADIEGRNIGAAGAFRIGTIQDQFAQASARNRLAAFSSGVRGHGRTLAQQEQRFRDDVAFQNLQLRQSITARQLAGADQSLLFSEQAALKKAQARSAQVKGIFQGAETFGKVAGLF